MAVIHFGHREITAKLVYFGAAQAGSNTNVRTLYGVLPAREKGRLHHFGPTGSNEQSWFFEYVPPQNVQLPGFGLRIRVYSMPGGITHSTHRREVFKTADAVVFVADARPDRADANRHAWAELKQHLREMHLDPDRLPTIVQVNHTDAPDARQPEQALADLGEGVPLSVAAVARSSKGVLETHDRAVTELVARIKENLGGNTAAIALVADQRDSPERDEDILARHLATLAAADRRSRPSLELAVQDLQVALSRRYQTLTPGPRFEVPFQPREFLGTRPVHLLDARLEGDQILVDLVLERLAGGEPRRLSVVLANRPLDATPVPRHTTPSPQPRPITSDLPDKVELNAAPEPSDFPPVWYGVVGAAGGALIGMLVMFLLLG
jgi:hypothetical protein